MQRAPVERLALAQHDQRIGRLDRIEILLRIGVAVTQRVVVADDRRGVVGHHRAGQQRRRAEAAIHQNEIEAEIADAVKFAEESPFPAPETATNFTYV